MSIESLQRAIHARSQPAAPQLPASGLVGLALPIAALGVVLIGMDLPLLGLLAWTGAIGVIAFALPRLYAAIATLLVTFCGLLLLRLVIGGAILLSGTEQLAFALVTGLAGICGQLLAAELSHRAALRRSDVDLGMHLSLLRSLFEGNRDCVKLIAADGTVLAINEASLQITAAVRDTQLLGQSWFAFWDTEQQKALADAWQRALRTGTSEYTGYCRIFTGERRSWHNTFTAVRLHEDAPPHLLCISRDITESVALQQNLKASVAQFNSLLNSIDDAFFALDPSWSINFANERGDQLFGPRDRTALPGANFWEVFPASSGDDAALSVRRAMELQSVQRCEYFHAPRQTWLGITAFPYPSGLCVLVRDITPLKLAEKQAAEENARLQVAQEIAGFGDWLFDYQQGLMKLSPRAVAMLEVGEYPSHEYKKRVLEKLHPQDRMALVQAIINSSTDAARLDLTVRMQTPAGDDRHIHWVGQLIVDEQGNPLRMLGAVQDVSVHLSAQEALEKGRRFVRDIVDTLPQHISVIDQQGKFVAINRAWERAWCDHYGVGQVPDNFFSYNEAVQGIDREPTEAAFKAARDLFAGVITHFELEYELNIHGERRNFMMHAMPLQIDGEMLVVFTHNEITAVKRLMGVLAQNEERMHELAENLPEIFWTYDIRAQRFTYISSAFEKIYKAPPTDILNDATRMMQYIHPEDRPRLEQSMQRSLQGTTVDNFQYRIIDNEGQLHWLSNHAVALRDQNNQFARISGTIRDITETKNYEQHLYLAAHIDDLTGLPNRKSLLEELQGATATAESESFALLLINLDRFKNINDTLGHSWGDELLRKAGQRLRATVGDHIFIARLGSDEFAVICPSASQQALSAAAMAAFNEPFQLQDEYAFVTVSVGVAGYPHDSRDPIELLKLAGVAMQRAKTLGRNNCQQYKDTMLLPSRERLVLETELRTALQRAEFELFYQGKFDLDSGGLIGAEALLRWHSQKRGLVSPADFIPLLEETGLILPVGEWILVQACAQVQDWHRRTGQWLPVAVNVSALQVSSRAFADAAIAILQSSALPPGVIELEITESALMSDAEHGAQLIKTLKAAGFSIALDDFGTGYSSLGYLRKFAPDTLKVDRSFIADLTSEASDQEIVAGIVQLARALKIEVVAEGIEMADQRRILCELGCHLGQGFLFCRPLPADRFESGIMALGPTTLLN